jgi:hypothetical protein
MLTDVAISGDRNAIQKEAKKILKYKDLTLAILHKRNVKTTVIPAITEAPYQETMRLGNYRKLPYWALHTYFGKC